VETSVPEFSTNQNFWGCTSSPSTGHRETRSAF